ncbi:substrate-binding domain-containing protein [Leifsonia aquatica]|uniref:substrate-binding domain-containing protein n=1 Tax=Leifsonia aquatica TaxID=144185 RepID=UPI00046AF7DF|nr:substrate-binding domain-containing protein [Leifsonia aquatica]
MNRPRRTTRRLLRASILAVATLLLVGIGLPASAAGYLRISGEGSSWAGNAVAQWVSDVGAQGVTVDYTPNGSSTGRSDFAKEINADFAVTEIPFTGDTSDPQDTTVPQFPYVMLPIVAGGTSFMYNLNLGGKRFTDLKLSQQAIAGIFTGEITQWNDKAIAADNPGVDLPAQRITVVVRSEGSGATAQFTLWLLRQYPDLYRKLCAKAGCDPAHATSYYPHQNLSNFVAQNGSNGVTAYTVANQFSINYDEYSYALGAQFPVAKVKNAAGFYTVPDQYAVAVALHVAKINTDKGDPNYLSQDLSDVYQYGDPRTYPLSMYTYQVAPSVTHGGFDTQKGATLGYFDQYSLCEGQRKMGNLGYSPLPMNLVLAALDQVKQIPGVDAATMGKINATGQAVNAGSGNPCNNPTFKPGDSPDKNQLLLEAPFPADCTPDRCAAWGFTGAGPAPQQNAGAKGPTGASAGATAGPAAANGAGQQQCDPDTGECGSGFVAFGSAANVKAVPMTLTGNDGWAGPQTLMVVVILLVLLLLIGPPIVSHVVSSRTGRGGR